MAIALFGGSFDPVHIGHLRSAIELRELLGIDQIQLLPCAVPPHAKHPLTADHHRLAMLELAVAEHPELAINPLEFSRPHPSYTVNTLRAIRAQMADDQPLYWCMGMDGLTLLDTWHQWQQLTDYAHLIVVHRPGWAGALPATVAQWLQSRQVARVAELNAAPAGKVLIQSMRQLEVSSTELRDRVARGLSIDFLTPPAVVNYIQQHSLYRQD